MKDAKTKYTLLGLLVILIWATSSTMIKQMVIFSNNNYLTDIVVYNALAFLVLLPTVIKRGEFKALKDKKVLKALIPAVLCNGFYDLFVTSAEGMSVRIQYAQIGNYMWPMLIVLLLGIKKKKPSKAGIFSTIVGFLAVLVLFVPEVIGSSGMNSKDVWALLLGVVAAILWANYSVILSTHEELNSSVYLLPTLGQGVSSLVMFVFATSCGKFNLTDIANTPALTCIVIYAIIGMSLSYVLWAFVMTKHPALENFSVLSYLTPVLSLLIATLYFRGTFNIQILVAGILIVIAIYISKLGDKKKQKRKMKNSMKFGLLLIAGVALMGCQNKHEELTTYSIGDTWGFVDMSGKVVVEAEYDEVSPFSEGLACVEMDGMYGYIDKTGKMVIEALYDYANDFSEGLACVKVDGKYGYIDKTGKMVIEALYDYANDFSEGLTWVRAGEWKDGKYGYIDKTGKMVIEPQFSDAKGFSEGLACVRVGDWKDGKYGYIDRTGKMVIEPQFSDANGFSEDLACVRVGDWEDGYGYIDKTGKIVIEPLPQYYANDFSEGLSIVVEDDKFGYIGKTGAVVIKPQYRLAGWFTDGYALVVDSLGGEVIIDKTGKTTGWANRSWSYSDISEGLEIEDGDISEGLCPYYKWETKGLVTKSGERLTEAIYDDIQFCNNGLVQVMKDGKDGLLDCRGKVVAAPVYDMIHEKPNGMFIVGVYEETDGADWPDIKVGMLDNKGKMVVDAVFDYIYEFSDEVMEVVKDHKHGFIDMKGNVVMEPQYDRIGHYHKDMDIARVEKGGKYLFVNGKGEMVLNVGYDIDNEFETEGPKTVWTQYEEGKYIEYLTVSEEKDSEGFVVDNSKGEVLVNEVKSAGDVIIPRAFKGNFGAIYYVVGVNEWAFRNNDEITTVELPALIRYIGEGAFASCTSMTAINIPQSVKSIGNLAFANCESLQVVNLNDNITNIMAYTFAGCRSLKKIELPESVTYIGPSAFMNCQNLKTITIPNTIENVYEDAFMGCDELKINGIEKNEWFKINKAKLLKRQ